MPKLFFDFTDEELANVEAPSEVTKILSDPNIEGYTDHFVVPSSKSGATIGSGVDLSTQSLEDLKKMGVSGTILKKIQNMGLFQKTGQAAREAIRKLPPDTLLTPQEVVQLSNRVSAHLEHRLQKVLPDWSNLPQGVKTVALASMHQYGESGFKRQNLYRQIKDRDYEAIRKNLLNWGDKSPGVADAINAKYARFASLIPLPTVLGGS